MRSDWQAVKLSEAMTLVVGFPFKSSLYTDAENGVALLRGDNIVQGRLRWDGVKRWPRQSVSDVSDFMLERGDIVLAMDRPWIEAGLKYACIEHHDLPCLLVQRVARLRAAERMHQGFLRYVIGSKAFTEHVLSVQTGTTVPHISGEQIKSFAFLLPPIKQQHAIASVLGALDDKIELNRRTNETLESMARGVFQSWFVDFDPVRACMEGRPPFGMDAETAALFPCAFAASPLGEIPQGWLTGTVRDYGSIVCGKTPPTGDPENYGGEMLFVTIPDMHGRVFVDQTAKTLSPKGVKVQPAKTLPFHSVCVKTVCVMRVHWSHDYRSQVAA